MYHLKIARSAVKIQMQVLYFPKLWKFVVNVFFSRLFMHTRYEQDPALHSCSKLKKKKQKQTNTNNK